MSTATIYMKAPVGTLCIQGTDEAVTDIKVVKKEGEWSDSPPKVLFQCMDELQEYFDDERKEFSVPFQPKGTVFQQAVWKAAISIPFGHTKTYSELAEHIQHKGASRAVGTALGKNPLLIAVPCHRILPKSGGVGGFAAGSKNKEWLLKHEEQ